MTVTTDLRALDGEAPATRAILAGQKRVVLAPNGKLLGQSVRAIPSPQLYARPLAREEYLNVALLALNLLLSVCLATLQELLKYPRRVQQRASLQRRIDAIDDLCRQRTPERPWKTSKSVSQAGTI
jgi:hypothetical protein